MVSAAYICTVIRGSLALALADIERQAPNRNMASITITIRIVERKQLASGRWQRRIWWAKQKTKTQTKKKANHSAHSMGSMRMEIKMKMAKWQAKHPLKHSEKGEQRKPPLRIHFTKRHKRQRGEEKPLEEPFSLPLWPICHLPAVNSFPERVSSASVAVVPRKCVKIPHREESAQGTRYKVSCTKLSHENMKENKVNFFHSSLPLSFQLEAAASATCCFCLFVVVCLQRENAVQTVEINIEMWRLRDRKLTVCPVSSPHSLLFFPLPLLLLRMP